MIQQEFRVLVEQAVYKCQEYLSERFLAAYLHGSIEKGDAVARVSDLDLFVIVSHWNADEDDPWLHKLVHELPRQYDVIDEAHITIATIDSLTEDRFARFALKYNAKLIAGEDFAAQIDQTIGEGYLPDKRLAQSRIGFARRCFDEALAGKDPACTGPLPMDTRYAARKLARYFVVIEGAYFLMSRDSFDSFDKERVLTSLRSVTNGFDDALDLVQKVLLDPIAANVSHDELLKHIRPLVLWMFDQIETV